MRILCIDEHNKLPRTSYFSHRTPSDFNQAPYSRYRTGRWHPHQGMGGLEKDLGTSRRGRQPCRAARVTCTFSWESWSGCLVGTDLSTSLKRTRATSTGGSSPAASFPSAIIPVSRRHRLSATLSNPLNVPALVHFVTSSASVCGLYAFASACLVANGN